MSLVDSMCCLFIDTVKFTFTLTWTDILLVCFVLSLACNGVDPQIEDQIRERLCFRFTNDLFQSEKKSSFFSQY